MGHFVLAVKSETKFENLLFSVGQLVESVLQYLLFVARLNFVVYGVGVRADYVAKKKHIPFPVHVQRLVERHFGALLARLSEVHKDFVFYAPRSERGKFYVLVGIVTSHRLDKSYRADGNEVVHIHARVVETLGNVHDKAQIMLYERQSRLLVARKELFYCFRFLVGRERGRQRIAL